MLNIYFLTLLLSTVMASSLSAECTPLKQAYDTCFNSWFQRYLTPSTSPRTPVLTSEEKLAQNRAKAADYEARCGSLWQEYQACVQRAVEGNGLAELLRESRDEPPLTYPSGSSNGSSSSQASTISLTDSDYSGRGGVSG
ncbi:hypothetical protein FRB94_004193 [Tulasnella sp. JGI-2019a]|nr:hypothetical protein FRB93_005887 [Tulasnella sp. JGI-2019a]KAG9001988.1 hypothetical protein FRB94_004193 [Tulasnella sp. JGI-2019a]KAG9030279.1 hypothetical protein FRB95_004165 [Tulasnella sp. JGI-2019a]